jgi:predicted GNAT family acetyltransferase
MKIGPVYTPPEHRTRGRATALVAYASSWALARGLRSCFLFTDLSNPTSNGIYRRIGYEQVGEAAMISFD